MFKPLVNALEPLRESRGVEVYWREKQTEETLCLYPASSLNVGVVKYGIFCSEMEWSSCGVDSGLRSSVFRSV